MILIDLVLNYSFLSENSVVSCGIELELTVVGQKSVLLLLNVGELSVAISKYVGIVKKKKKNHSKKGGSHKEVYLTHGRGELCSPAGDRRSPLVGTGVLDGPKRNNCDAVYK